MTRSLFDPPDDPDAGGAGSPGKGNHQPEHSEPVGGDKARTPPSPEIPPDGVNEAEGAELEKLRALARHAARHGTKIGLWQREFVKVLLELPESEAALLEVVRTRLGNPAGECRWLGAVTHGLAEAGVIERAGFTAGKRRVGHGAPRSLWRLTSADAGRAWLASHPAPADGAIGG